jgi:hypothetical protein
VKRETGIVSTHPGGNKMETSLNIQAFPGSNPTQKWKREWKRAGNDTHSISETDGSKNAFVSKIVPDPERGDQGKE